MEEMSMQIAQLQALTADLKAGLVGAIQDLSVLKQSSCVLEDRMRNYQNDIEEKILGIRNSLNTFKEDLSTALTQIKELNCRHVEMQRGVELFHAEVGRHLLTCQQRCQPGAGRQRSAAGWPRCQVWAAPKDPAEGQGTEEGRKRYAAALELLESERQYVSHLSLLLKANITFNGAEAIHPKGKRPFPSSLRFLIQQHLELLHTLQERVLRFQWQGIMGDVFLRLFSKESDFLDFYVTYLKELPDCLAVVGMYTSSSAEASGLFEGDVTGKENRPPLRTLLLQPVQRIPEYLTLLQNLLKLTEAEHPDYFLLLLCMQQLRAFTGQQGHLLQQGQELLLLHGCREVKRQHQNQVKRRVPEQRQGREPQDWGSAGTPLSHGPFFGGDASPWLGSVPGPGPRLRPLPRGPWGRGLRRGEAYAVAETQSRLPGVAAHPGRGRPDATPPPAGWAAQEQVPERLAAGQRHLRGYRAPEFPGTPKARSPHGGPHAWLERQSSRGSAGGRAQRSVSPLQKLEPQDLPRDFHKVAPPSLSSQTTVAKLQLTTSADCASQVRVEDSRRRRGSEENVRSFSERSRKEDQKGGIRSSFRKLFKKKSSGEIKEKVREKTEAEAYGECARSPQVARPADADRGTAV
ncbi:hypothetical protein ANANG_G00050140 [Anguilla anguilla]|uniref:DH domain-containing protein n=1 Tax=Anguilla anguilla TaxID=7936 RepID=A0A9D3MVE1_ANGAN|nr:hypothetical protein ANANG_G00050140 [Anguilla anguilla]